jgi:hypothetical protein
LILLVHKFVLKLNLHRLKQYMGVKAGLGGNGGDGGDGGKGGKGGQIRIFVSEGEEYLANKVWVTNTGGRGGKGGKGGRKGRAGTTEKSEGDGLWILLGIYNGNNGSDGRTGEQGENGPPVEVIVIKKDGGQVKQEQIVAEDWY